MSRDYNQELITLLQALPPRAQMKTPKIFNLIIKWITADAAYAQSNIDAVFAALAGAAPGTIEYETARAITGAPTKKPVKYPVLYCPDHTRKLHKVIDLTNEKPAMDVDSTCTTAHTTALITRAQIDGAVAELCAPADISNYIKAAQLISARCLFESIARLPWEQIATFHALVCNTYSAWWEIGATKNSTICGEWMTSKHYIQMYAGACFQHGKPLIGAAYGDKLARVRFELNDRVLHCLVDDCGQLDCTYAVIDTQTSTPRAKLYRL